jgi:hypothetical protein
MSLEIVDDLEQLLMASLLLAKKDKEIKRLELLVESLKLENDMLRDQRRYYDHMPAQMQ